MSRRRKIAAPLSSFTRFIPVQAALALMLAWAASGLPLSAADPLVWSGSDSVAGGTGTWSTSTSAWNNGTKVFANGNDVLFSEDATVTVSGTVQPGSISVSDGKDVTLAGGVIDFGATQGRIDIGDIYSPTKEVAINSSLSGSAGFTVVGLGAFSVSGNNTATLSGTVVIGGRVQVRAGTTSFGTGTIQIGDGYDQGDVNSVARLEMTAKTLTNDVVLNGGELRAYGGAFGGEFKVDGDITIVGGVWNRFHVTDSTAAHLNIRGDLAGEGNLLFTNSNKSVSIRGVGKETDVNGIWRFSGAGGSVGLYDGRTVDAGTSFEFTSSFSVQLNGSNTIDALSSTHTGARIGGFATLTVAQASDTTYSGNFLDSGGAFNLVKAGSGRLVLDGINASTNSGMVTVTGGELAVNTTFSNASAVFTVSGGVLSGTGSIAGDLMVSGGAVSPGGTGAVETFNVGGDVIWDGGGDAWRFDLGLENVADLLVVGGSLLKGSGTGFVLDFGGTGEIGSYTVASFQNTTFDIADFSFADLAPGLTGVFSITGGTQLDFNVSAAVVPEPSTWAVIVGVIALGTTVWRRRRHDSLKIR